MRKKDKNKAVSRKAKVIFATALFLSLYLPGAYPLPQVDEVVSGTVQFDQIDANTLSITASDQAIINYFSFSIDYGQTVIMSLPSSSSSVLNRVLGGSLSELFGNLSSNGLFILVNEAGIHIGPNAVINSASIILSTRDISNSNFLNRNYFFERLSQDQVDRLLLNQGTITVSNAGFGVLIAGGIENQGRIVAKVGKIALASGDAVRLELSSDGLISVAIDEPVANTVYDLDGNPITDQIKNTGTLEAVGGTIILSAESLPGIFEKAINLEGVVRAENIEITTSGIVRLNATIEADNIQIGQKDALVPENSIIPENVTISKSIDIENTINIIAQDYIKVSASISAATVTLESGGSIDTEQGVVISASSLNLIANYFGSHSVPLDLYASSLHINKLTGDINIRESLGIGTSILLRGPPEDNFAISYNSSANLTLEAQKTILSGDGSIYLYGNITFYNLEVTTSGKELYFEAGHTYTFLGVTNIEGTRGSANIIKLLSSEEGSAWYINIASPDYTLSNIAVGDSYNIGEESIYSYPKTDFGGNTGWLENDTVYIDTWTELNAMRNNLSWDYILEGNLSSATGDYAGIGDGWTPVGDDSTPFTGTLDGDGYVISDLTINSTAVYVGLFGYTDGAAIQNVALTNVSITRSSATTTCYVGGLVGYNKNTSITNSYVTGSVTATSTENEIYAGGLVGENYASSGGTASITDSYATSSVTATAYGFVVVGGLVGYNYASGNGGTANITNSYATGNLSAESSETGEWVCIGGLVGENSAGSSSTADITDSYATGSVLATSTENEIYAGGLVGYLSRASIIDSYATGTVSVAADNIEYVGGLVGDRYSGVVTSSYWDTQTSGQASSDGGTGETTANMQQPATFINAGWNITTTWDLSEGSYPTLGSGSVTLTTATNDVPAATYNALTLNGSGITFTSAGNIIATTLTISQGTLDIDNYDLTVSNTFSNEGTLKLQGGQTINVTMDTNSGTVYYDGSSIYSSLAVGDNYYSLTFNSSGSWSLDAALDVNNNLTISNGTLNAAGYAMTIGRNFSNSGTFTHGNNTVTFDGTGTQNITSNNSSFYNLTINKTSGSAVLIDALDADNNLTITNGTLNAAGYAMTIGRNFSNSGTFIHGNNTVTLNGTNQTISGSNVFYNLTKANSGILSFEASETQSVSGKLTLTGVSADSKLTIKSTSDSSYWYVNILSNSYEFNNLLVSDSYNLGTRIYTNSNMSITTNRCIGWGGIEPLILTAIEKAIENNDVFSDKIMENFAQVYNTYTGIYISEKPFKTLKVLLKFFKTLLIPSAFYNSTPSLPFSAIIKVQSLRRLKNPYKSLILGEIAKKI